MRYHVFLHPHSLEIHLDCSIRVDKLLYVTCQELRLSAKSVKCKRTTSVQNSVFLPVQTFWDGQAGLGLAIAECTVEANGGKIALESDEGGGVRFASLCRQ